MIYFLSALRLMRRRLIAAVSVLPCILISGCAAFSREAPSLPEPFYPTPSFRSGPIHRQGRLSTTDPSGANFDFWILEAGESRRLGPIIGEGEITHVWLTGAGEKLWEKFAVLRMFWDNAARPAVQVPIGDFFLLGDGLVSRIQTLPIKVTRPEGGYNCYFTMPFRSQAVVEITNEGAHPLALWMHVDYRLCPLKSGAPYFHAAYRQEFPTRGWGDARTLLKGTTASEDDASRRPADPADNYTILNVTGRGCYLGCYLLVQNRDWGWAGEGDDLILVDGDPAAGLRGTGLEDYFGSAFGFQRGQFDLFGVPATHAGWPGGLHTAYRFHFDNPIVFRRSLHVSVEHGEANHRSDDYASVAYWYMDTPEGKAERLPEASRRLTGEMRERLLLFQAFDSMARLEREGQWASALSVCEQALFETKFPFYREILELKKAGLLFRAGQREAARAWLHEIYPRLVDRDRRGLAAALLDFLESSEPAGFLIVRGDDVWTLDLNEKRIAAGDFFHPWDTFQWPLPPGSYRITVSVHNVGYHGGLALALFHQNGVLATGPEWGVTENGRLSEFSKKSPHLNQAQLYGFPAHTLRDPGEMNPFHFLGADVPWIWGPVNYMPGQTLFFHNEFKVFGPHGPGTANHDTPETEGSGAESRVGERVE